jgi:hypothetical protein
VGKLATADRMLGAGKDVADVCCELAISEQPSYRWRDQFGGLKADDAERLKDLLRPPQPPAPTDDRRSSTPSAGRSDWVVAGVRGSWREFAAGAERG